MTRQFGRREFAQALLVQPIGTFLLRCSSSSSDGNGAPAASPQVNGGQAVYTSSEVSAHDHTFAIDLANFVTPPAGGVSGDTSNNDGHTHGVTVSMGDLQQVQMGDTVMVTTTLNSGHTHVFTFTKVAGASTAEAGKATSSTSMQ